MCFPSNHNAPPHFACSCAVVVLIITLHLVPSLQYQFYVNNVTKTPVGFNMMGYDELLGSHYDQYVITYLSFTPNAKMPDSLFTPPASLQCGDFPGAMRQDTRRGCEVAPDPTLDLSLSLSVACALSQQFLFLDISLSLWGVFFLWLSRAWCIIARLPSL